MKKKLTPTNPSLKNGYRSDYLLHNSAPQNHHGEYKSQRC